MNIILSIQTDELVEYIVRQLNFFFPDNKAVMSSDIKKVIDTVLDRVKYCFAPVQLKYYNDGKSSLFNHLNTDHYCIFLYFLSNTLYKENRIDIAEKVFYLNKALNGIDAFYSVKLPDIFMVVHPLGTILGNANYSNYFVVYQNCTIGSSKEGIYPSFGEKIVMYSKSSIIGDCKIGSNVTFASNSFVINKDISENQVVYGIFPNNFYKKTEDKIINNFYSF